MKRLVKVFAVVVSMLLFVPLFGTSMAQAAELPANSIQLCQSNDDDKSTKIVIGEGGAIIVKPDGTIVYLPAGSTIVIM